MLLNICVAYCLHRNRSI